MAATDYTKQTINGVNYLISEATENVLLLSIGDKLLLESDDQLLLEDIDFNAINFSSTSPNATNYS